MKTLLVITGVVLLFATPVIAQAPPYWWVALHSQYLTAEELAQVNFAQPTMPLPPAPCPAGFVCTPIPPVIPAPVQSAVSTVESAVTALPAPASNCPTLYGAFASYSQTTSPRMTAGALVSTVAPFVKCAPGTAQMQSYTQYIEAPVKVNGSWTLQQTITTGMAVPIRSIPFIPGGELWALGTIGAAVAGSTSTTKLGTTYGGMMTLPLFGKFMIAPAFEIVNGNKQAILALIF